LLLGGQSSRNRISLCFTTLFSLNTLEPHQF
jgi:hypothetical protein